MTAQAPVLRYLGHSTVALDLDGVRVLTDPLLVDRLGPLHRHGPRPHPRPDERGVDLVLISHAHHDHLDLASLGRVRGRPRIVVPKGIAELLARAGHEVIPVSVGDRLRLGPLKIEAVPARHDGGRKPFGPAAEALGFRIEGSASVYFAGDTGLFREMAELAGSVDVALLPVWGWGPRLGDGHLDPHDAAEAVRLIGPRMAVPIHWGTFYPFGLARLWSEPLTRPPHDFAREVARRAPGTTVQILAPGQTALI